MVTIDENSTDEQQFKFAVNLLTGRALTWWRHNLTFGPSMDTFSALRDAIYLEFVDIDHVNKLRDELDNLTLSKSNTVTKYIQRFRELHLELGPHAPDEETALHRFLKGLHGEIKLYTSLQ